MTIILVIKYYYKIMDINLGTKLIYVLFCFVFNSLELLPGLNFLFYLFF